MGRERHAHLPVKTQCFAHLGISCELGKRKKLGRETHAAFTCENTMFFAV